MGGEGLSFKDSLWNKCFPILFFLHQQEYLNRLISVQFEKPRQQHHPNMNIKDMQH